MDLSDMIKFNSPYSEKIINAIINRIVKEKTGLDVTFSIDDLSIEQKDGNIDAKVTVRLNTNTKEVFNKIIELI